MPMLDWIFVAVLCVSTVVGIWRGLVYEVLSVLNWIAAFVLAQWFAPMAAQRLPMAGASEVVRYAAGFVLVFVVSLFAGGLVAFLIRKLVAAVGLRPVDRVLGAVFGLVRGVVIKGPWWQESTGSHVATVALQGLKPVLPEEFGKYLP